MMLGGGGVGDEGGAAAESWPTCNPNQLVCVMNVHWLCLCNFIEENKNHTRLYFWPVKLSMQDLKFPNK